MRVKRSAQEMYERKAYMTFDINSQDLVVIEDAKFCRYVTRVGNEVDLGVLQTL